MSATREQLYAALQRADAAGDTAAARAIAQRLAGATTPAPLDQPAAPEFDAAAETGIGESFLIGSGKAAMDFLHGGRQAMQKLADLDARFGPGGITQKLLGTAQAPLQALTGSQNREAQDAAYNEELRTYAQLQAQHPVATTLGEIAPQMAIPAAGGASVAARAGMNALIAGATERLKYQPTEKQAQANQAQAAAAAAGVTTLFGALGKTVNAFRRVYNDSKAARLSQELEQAGITHGFADVAQPNAIGRAIKGIDEWLASVPLLGTGGRKQAQVEQITSRLMGIKDRLMEKLSGMAPEDAIAEAVERATAQVRQQAGSNFDEVRRLASGLVGGSDEMAKSKASALAHLDAKASDEKLFPENVAAREWLGTIDEGLPRTFQQMRGLRDYLGNMIEDSQRGAAHAPTFMTPYYTQMKTALEKDIDSLLSKAGGKANEAYTQAKRFFAENVVPLRQRGLIRDINTGKVLPDAIIGRAIQENRYAEARRLYALVDQRGKEAINYAIIERGLNKAERNVNGDTAFDPQVFATYLGRMDRAMHGMDKAIRREIDGAARIMRHLEGLRRTVVNKPQTGYTEGQIGRTATTAGALTGAGMVGGPVLAAKMAALPLTFRALFGSDAGRRFLLASSELKPGSPQMARLWQSASRFGQRMGEAISTNNLPTDD